MKALDLAGLLRVPRVDQDLKFDLAPDGGRVAFAWNKTGRWEIFETNPDGSTAPLPVSTGPGAKFSPRYSPRGDLLAYAADLDGSESYHVILFDRAGGEERDLTPGIGYAHQPNLAWSPEGSTLALLSDESGHFALYLLSIGDGSKKPLLDLHRPIWDLAWSPDGEWIATVSESSGSTLNIHLVNTRSGDFRPLQASGENLNANHPAWCGDSKSLVFSGENGEWHAIGKYDLSTGAVAWITDSPGDHSQPSISPDGRSLAWVHAVGAQAHLEVRSPLGALTRFQVGAGIHSWPQFTAAGLLCLYEDPGRPPDLWHLKLTDGTFSQITRSPDTDVIPNGLVEPREIHYRGKDGVEIPAVLYAPAGASPRSPAAIYIHGGPNWHMQFIWHPLIAHLGSRGWTVLAPNYRGSTGYGRSWRNASRFDMGGVDTDDCAAGADYLVESGQADRNRIAVTGSSHGGFLTMTCMTNYPHAWAAGSAVVPFLNWIKSHDESRPDLQHWNIENMGDPHENRALWIERSPFFHLERIAAPVQLICGGNDPRCPASDSIDAYDKLMELGKSAELFVYPDQGHGFLDTEALIDAEIKRVDFLSRALEPA